MQDGFFKASQGREVILAVQKIAAEDRFWSFWFI